jgi:tetrahydromethanopterin S-methyltransferase subunit G
MAEPAENLVLEHLRAIRGEIGEIKRRIVNVETELVQQGRLIAILVDGQAHARARFAAIEARLGRIEKRLELTGSEA